MTKDEGPLGRPPPDKRPVGRGGGAFPWLTLLVTAWMIGSVVWLLRELMR